MKPHRSVPSMQLPISLETAQLLYQASFQTALKKEDWEIGEIAIREWMTRHSPESFKIPATSGYQWKHLFLPSGTLLRTVFDGKNFHCLVEEDRIMYEGESTSPSRFANAVGGVNRNAWKVIWILFPDSHTWKLAASLRPQKKQNLRRN
jgi:hypothetical protein